MQRQIWKQNRLFEEIEKLVYCKRQRAFETQTLRNIDWDSINIFWYHHIISYFKLWCGDQDQLVVFSKDAMRSIPGSLRRSHILIQYLYIFERS